MFVVSNVYAGEMKSSFLTHVLSRQQSYPSGLEEWMKARGGYSVEGGSLVLLIQATCETDVLKYTDVILTYF